MKSQMRQNVFVAMSPHRSLRNGAGQAGGSLGATSKRIFVAMSGGVDSSVAAALLKARGFHVVGCHMKCFNVDGCAERDAEDARRVAEQLHIPFYVFDFEDEYKKRVVDYMIKGYKAGITPNPDVMCNKEIKFGLFFEKARSLGADYVATGHYVRKLKSKNKKGKSEVLATARDLNKDQSYFLWTLTQKQLAHCLFPIGEYTKPQVRALAKKFGLLTATKKDSQGICFLGQVSIRDFLKKYIRPKKGNVLTVDGRIVGTHEGAHLYTIGQRNLGIKNMELGIKNGGDTVPHYVVAKDLKANTITIAPENHPALYQKEIALTDVNFISPKLEIGNWKFGIPLRVLARVRYRQPLAKAQLVTFKYSQTGCKLMFKVPQNFVAVGQSAVFYSAEKRNSGAGREMLGGGIITA